MTARRLAVSITLALLCITLGGSHAHANGRFPQAQAIVSVPGGDGGTLFLRATFGVLVSRDGGKSWRYLCERALGYEGTWDPPIAATRDGRLWVGLENGLVSTADGCTVSPSTELEGETVKDLTTDAKGEVVYAITGVPGKKSWIWRRSAAETSRFIRLGGLDDTNFMTIEVAPSKPSRVYVSGQPYGTVRGRLYRSDDGGRTLKGQANDLEAEGPLFIAGIDPKDERRVILRHLHTTGSDVLVTGDGGKTFRNVLSMKSAMFGFAKSADGKTYWAGSGLAEHGIFRSVDRGESWERLAQHGVLCLHAAGAGRLFVCENPFTLGAPAIGVSTDEGKTVRSIATFAAIEGAVACPPSGLKAPGDAGGAICASVWPETRAQIVARPDAGHAGEPSARRDVTAVDAGADAGRDPKARSSTCGCTIVGRREPADRWAPIVRYLALVLGCSALARRWIIR